MRRLLPVTIAGLVTAGFIGVAAALAGSDISFGVADANADRFVSYTEARGIFPTLGQELFDKADDNGDGKLDEGEYTELLGLSAVLTAP